MKNNSECIEPKEKRRLNKVGGRGVRVAALLQEKWEKKKEKLKDN